MNAEEFYGLYRQAVDQISDCTTDPWQELDEQTRLEWARFFLLLDLSTDG